LIGEGRRESRSRHRKSGSHRRGHHGADSRRGAQTAVAIERVAFGVLGDVAAAVNAAADQVTLAKGANVTLDADVAAVKTFKSELQTVGVKAG
jgi:hypothetical protein